MALSRLAISTRSLSPVRWPRLSLTCLKSSRSRNITVRPSPGAPSRPKGESELLLETAAVGQLGDGVEARHSIDFELGVAALGDVLDDQNGALACHAMDRDLEGAIVERFERNDEIDRTVVAGENGGETRKLRLGDDAVADQLGQDRFDMRARRERRRGED